jgi:tetratricopeptide (TPR) repeat protein
VQAAALVLLFGGVIGLQVARERLDAGVPVEDAPAVLYVRSPEVVARLALSYESVLADVYWMRALQHYGRTRLQEGGDRRYDLLFPLLDLATTLDPLFNVAYRFGAIFLTESPPGGPGRADHAIALLEKGLAAQPLRWEFALDIGFVHYRNGDYLAAADGFARAARIPGAPNWLPPLEAVTRTRGGSRETSRQLWTQIVAEAEPEERWLRDQAALRLRQLDALDQIDVLEDVVAQYRQRMGVLPSAWIDLIAAGYLRTVPADPSGRPYRLHPWWGTVTLDPQSPLSPLPTPEAPVR